ncbi:MAG: sulfotransferase [Pseudomonadota bacterium]
MKIIQIGFNKCGTRSMYQFFRQNKIPSVHWAHGTVGRDIRINLTTGRRPFEGHEDYVFYSDLMGTQKQPVFEGQYHFRDFYNAYEGALFILNTRDEDAWIASRQRHPNFVRRFAIYYDLETPEEVETLWRAQWKAHHADVRAFFADKQDVFMEFDIDRQGGAELAAFVAPHYTTDVSLWGHVGKAEDEEAKAKLRRERKAQQADG